VWQGSAGDRRPYADQLRDAAPELIDRAQFSFYRYQQVAGNVRFWQVLRRLQMTQFAKPTCFQVLATTRLAVMVKNTDSETESH
jgi:hypothetical protein